MGSREMGILNYEFSFCLFFGRCGYSSVQLQYFYSPRRRKDAKSDFRFSPLWIFVYTTAIVLPFRQRIGNELKASTAKVFLA